jgi:hypothetical protein
MKRSEREEEKEEEEGLPSRDSKKAASGSSADPEQYFRAILGQGMTTDHTKKKSTSSLPDAPKSTATSASKQEASPEYYEFTLDTINNIKLADDARLRDAYKSVVECKDYHIVLCIIQTQGPVQVQIDNVQRPGAAWNSGSRTITINPDRLTELGHTVLGALAFELMNAHHDGEFRAMLKEVEQGRIRNPDEYARKAEQIEYNSASLRAAASLKMIKSGQWKTADDPQLRHFMKQSKELGDLTGTGLWMTFDGYLDTQMENGHYDGHKDRFAALAPRDVKEELERARLKEAATQRYLQRKQQKNTITTKDPKEVLSKSGYAEFQEAEEQGEFEGKRFEMQGGKMCRLFSKIEDDYIFKIV